MRKGSDFAGGTTRRCYSRAIHDQRPTLAVCFRGEHRPEGQDLGRSGKHFGTFRFHYGRNNGWGARCSLSEEGRTPRLHGAGLSPIK